MKFFPKLPMLAALVVLSAAFSHSASGQCQSGTCPRPAVRYAPTYRVTYAQPAPRYYAAPAQVQAAPMANDPLREVNIARNRRGLHSLVYDGNLAAHAAQNNFAQAARGLGHHRMAPGAAQCAAVGTSSPQSAVAVWSGSPPHAAILYSRTMTRAGLAVNGSCATLNCQ